MRNWSCWLSVSDIAAKFIGELEKLGRVGAGFRKGQEHSTAPFGTLPNFDGVTKNRHARESWYPEAGSRLKRLDSHLRGNDETGMLSTFCETINFDGLAKSLKTGFFLKITPVISTSYESIFLVFRLFARPSILVIKILCQYVD